MKEHLEIKRDCFAYFDGRIGDIYQFWYCGTYDWAYVTDFIIEKAFTRVRLKGIRSILDCACGGCGEPTISFWKKGSYQICCSDGSSKMLSTAKLRLKDAQAGIEIIDESLLWNELELYFKDRKFDAVVCLANSICHVSPDDLPSILENMMGILREGGILILDSKRYSNEGRELHFEVGKGLVERARMDHGKRILPDGVATMFTEVLYDECQPNKETIRVTVKYEDGREWTEDCGFLKYGVAAVSNALLSIGVTQENITILEPEAHRWKYELICAVK